jgi:hypothetical protein
MGTEFDLKKDYSYEDYLESDEVSNPFEASEETDLNGYNTDFTNSEIRDSLGAGSDSDSDDESEGYAKSAGADLNDGAGKVTGAIGKETVDDTAGEDLNDAGAGQLDAVLDNFGEDTWSDLSLEDQKQSMTDLAGYVANETGNRNPPEIVFRGDMKDGEYGGYNPGTNTLEINENMLGDSGEAADTVAHEMWHAHQQQCALDPASEKGREYQEGFDNYISPEYDFEGYENQMVEAEAREYAQGFKDKLAGMKGAA